MSKFFSLPTFVLDYMEFEGGGPIYICPLKKFILIGKIWEKKINGWTRN